MVRDLFDLLFPPRVDERILRDVSVDDFLAKVAPRLAPDTRPGTVVLLSFGDPLVRAAIHEMKYHGSVHARKLLSATLAEYLRDSDVGFTKSHITLVPIPLGEKRHEERGFNQVEEVARDALAALARDENASCTLEPDLLVRARETVSQVSLPRQEREENMRGAFLVSPKLEERRRIDPSRTYMVIDDVLTTGATLSAAIDALTSAGAKNIIPLALAH